jgi:hypothetical protein
MEGKISLATFVACFVKQDRRSGEGFCFLLPNVTRTQSFDDTRRGTATKAEGSDNCGGVALRRLRVYLD